MSDGGPNRKQVKDALRALGLSSRQVDALLRAGWAALVGTKDAEIAELEDAVEALSARLGQKGRKVIQFPRSSQDSAEPEADLDREVASALDEKPS